MVTKNKVEGADGIHFTRPEAQVAPPFAGREEEEELREHIPPRGIGGVGAEEKLLRAVFYLLSIERIN